MNRSNTVQGPQIYAEGDRLLDLLMQLMPNIKRLYQYNIGSELLTMAVRLNLKMRQANSARGKDKLPFIDDILNYHGMIELLLRKMHDSGIISSKMHAQFILVLTSIGKQANGWRNHYSA